MIIMAVDLGDVRTGVAVSDGNGKLAFPKAVISERNREKRLQKIADLAAETNAAKLIVGYPKNTDGTAGAKAEEYAGDAAALSKLTGIPTVLWDERFTTVIANDALNDAGTRGRKKRAIIDSAAAVKLLESYLRYLELNRADGGLTLPRR